MSRPWLPLYVGDYLADTGHLRAAEHGAYLMLIMHYWQRRSLPDDDRQLSAIARMSPAEWKRARPVIEPFFKPGWVHERIDRELAEAEAAYERRANAGRKGGMASVAAKQSASIASSNASSIAPALPEQSQPQPQPHTQPSIKNNRERGNKPARAQIAFAIGMEITTDCRLIGDAYGLSGDGLEAEWRRFIAKKVDRGATTDNVAAAFMAWCEDIAKYGPARKADESAKPATIQTVRVDRNSPQGQAWESYLASKGKRRPPWTDGRWHFPTEWPPGAGPPAGNA